MSVDTEQPERPLTPHRGQISNPLQGKGRLTGKSSRRQASGWAKVLILLILTIMAVFLGGDIRHMMAGSATPAPRVLAKTGPFIQAPLSPNQVDKLQHLSSYFSDKTLARMYLSHMTLDQKLGQLFMVQYWGYSYSSDLETMIHDQYAGGVIMYVAQMNTLNQTKNDIMRMQKKACDPTMPAELSHTIVTDILRHQFGYDGVVLTDALYMLGIAKKWSVPQAVVLAIEAGNDMILGIRDPSVLSDSVAALKQALADGSLSMERIDEAVTRIIALKIQP